MEGLFEGDIDQSVMTILFNSLDADSDGKLSMNELMGMFGDKQQAASVIQPFFDACDKDGDKRITLEEFKEFYKVMEDSSDSEDEEWWDDTTVSKLFKSMDTDGDGTLVIGDLRALVEGDESVPISHFQDFFDACDTNKDQRITLEEFKAFYKKQDEQKSTEPTKKEKTYGGMTEETMEKLFKSLDADSDGTLVMNDLRALVDAEASDADMKPFFDACDTNGDKRITLEEFKAFYKGMGEDQEETEGDKKEPEEKTYGGMTVETMEKLFKSLDVDSDGKLVMNELRAMMGDQASDDDMKPFFDACDTDGDKRITLEEFKAFYKGMGEDQEETEGDKKEPEDDTAGGMTEDTMEKLFKSLDADSDGTLVMNELKALVDAEASDADMKPFFDACDTDGDKRITLEEFKAFYKNM